MSLRSEDFHPDNKTFWTLAMVGAWISWRDLKALIPTARKTLSDLASDEALSIEDVASGQKVTTIKWARDDLWKKLQAGELIGYGKRRNADRVAIDPLLWIDLVLGGYGTNRDFLTQHLGSPSSNDWHHIVFKSADVRRIWPESIVPGTTDGKGVSNDNQFSAKVGSHRPRTLRDSAIRILKEIDPAMLNGKRIALLAEVNSRLGSNMSLFTLRRAIEDLEKAKG